MAYKFFEDFSRYNDRREPYSLFSEETTRYDVPDAKIDEKGYRILRQSTKQIISTPSLPSFTLTLSVILEKSVLSRGKTVNEWSVFFGYSREKRCGKELRLTYIREDKRFVASLFDVTAIKEYEIQSETIEDFILPCGVEHILRLEASPDGVTLYIKDNSLNFNTAVSEGNIAISTQKGVNGIIFRHISIDSDCEPCVTSSRSAAFAIPRFDGGEADHILKLTARTYENGVFELDCTLDGGVYYKKIDLHNVDNWTAPYEHFVNPYIRLIKNDSISHKLYIKNGRLYFVAKDYENKSIENILDSAEMPYNVKFFGENLSDFDAVAFGYSKKLAFGHEFFGEKREFVFTLDGNLIYNGDELGAEYLSKAISQADKQIIKLIPEYVTDREDAITHARNNHTFIKGENARFSVLLHTKNKAAKISVKAELTNAYFKRICDLDVSDTKAVPDITDRFGYSTICTSINITNLEQSVYHLIVTWYYGDTKCHTHKSAFEVIDTELSISPQQSAGLPLMYVGDGAPRDTTGVVPDMWSPKSDFSIEHYFSTAEYLPSVSEKKKPWELLDVYKRSIFVWMTQRTIGNLGAEKFPLTTQNADYINYYMPTVFDSSHNYRCDLWNADVYDSPTVRSIFEAFRQSHPEFDGILNEIPTDTPLTVEHLKSMMPYCFDAWTDFFNKEDERRLCAQWDKIKKLNPKAKRSSYGPFPLYGTALAGGYHSKWFGMPPETMARLFDGFCQFEDYPFVCAYGSHYSAWGMMTIKQLSPDSKIAPELYDSFAAVCPDGFVASAFPPLGESHAEPYMTSTQVYEYLYNTPTLRLDGSFTYWHDNCFMFYSLYMEEPKARMAEFLRDWGNYLENRPKSPIKCISYLAEFDTDDNRRETDIHVDSIYNLCQSGEAYIHECAAECGLSAGFVVDYSSIHKLTPDMTDILVISSMRHASDEVKDKIRALYESGVALISVGDVSGLEDIFGVKKEYRVQSVSKVILGNQAEHIFPYDAEFFYAPDGAETILYTDGEKPVLMRKENAVLINCSLNQVGVDNYKPLCFYGRPNISRLLKKAVSEILCALATPYAKADGACGVTSFITENGDTELLLIDYSRFDDPTDKKTHVEIFDSSVRDVECISRPDIKIGRLFEGDSLKEFNITMKHHEALLFRLKK